VMDSLSCFKIGGSDSEENRLWSNENCKPICILEGLQCGHPLTHYRSRYINFISSSLSPALQQQPVSSYSIQSIVTSASATSAFSFPVSNTILDLTISEFILWTTNLRKYTNFIRLQILKLT
jgi:hypothetical protein